MRPAFVDRGVFLLLSWAALCAAVADADAETPIDLRDYDATCQVRVAGWNGHLRVNWPIAAGEEGEAVLDLSGTQALLQRLAVRKLAAGQEAQDSGAILANVNPRWFVTAGQRKLAGDRPPDQAWQVFFDNPHQRPHETFTSQLTIKQAKVTGHGSRATIAIDGLSIGPFQGTIELTFFAGSRLARIDAVVQTETDGLAIFYDQGLIGGPANWQQFAWIDTEGQTQRTSAVTAPAQPLQVRHRAIAAANDNGAVACFPPPHQFQFPRDYTTNLGFAWAGSDYQGQTGQVGFGIRQQKDGGGNWVPWFNAPPKTQQRLGAFYVIVPGTADDALQETLRYTSGDRFPPLAGFKTFTTHYHMAIAVAAMQEQKENAGPRRRPDWVNVLRDMGVNMVHLGEFHGDGHPRDPGPLRLPEMQAMFDECRRWSTDDLLFMPGEEANEHLGLKIQGKHPGHWMCFFPRPVYWTMVRGAEQPFVEEIAPYGKVYHVGSRGDMIRLLKEERGLAWSAHPRIKASSWTPDVFRHEDFFLAEFWLGGAWKAMPGDLSRAKLGERVLDLLDDMANWGHRKYVPGEVDVFKIDHTHELYAHMNANYLQMDRVPKFDEGWQPVLDVLSRGKFFVTTGEVLLPRFTVGGQGSGDVLKLAADGRAQLVAELQWTFPLAFAEVISGDGEKVYRERIDLTDTGPFGTRTLERPLNLAGRKWARLEVWDVAANGAFTQPVWLE